MRCLPGRGLCHCLVDRWPIAGFGPVARLAADRHRRRQRTVDAEPRGARVQLAVAADAGDRYRVGEAKRQHRIAGQTRRTPQNIGKEAETTSWISVRNAIGVRTRHRM